MYFESIALLKTDHGVHTHTLARTHATPHTDIRISICNYVSRLVNFVEKEVFQQVVVIQMIVISTSDGMLTLETLIF